MRKASILGRCVAECTMPKTKIFFCIKIRSTEETAELALSELIRSKLEQKQVDGTWKSVCMFVCVFWRVLVVKGG